MPFLKTPYFISASQDDLFQILEDVGHAPITKRAVDYANRFANLTRQLVLHLHQENSVEHAVFSWGCFNHAVSMSNEGFNVWTSGEPPDVASTMNDALVAFLRWGNGATEFEWVDRCIGWKCGKGC